MQEIKLKTGDMFATKNPMALGMAINCVQTFWSKDNESIYSHAGIITNMYGGTFEALWTIKEDTLKKYIGKQIIIARSCYLESSFLKETLKRLKFRHNKQIYPIWRLVFMLAWPLSKYVSWGGKFVVCSELVAEYLFLLGIRHKQYIGTNPDTLADEWRRWRELEVICEGILDYKNNKFYIK